MSPGPVGKPPGRWASLGAGGVCPPLPGPPSDPLGVRWHLSTGREPGRVPADHQRIAGWHPRTIPAACRRPGGGLRRRLPVQGAAQVFLAVGRGLHRRCEPLHEPAARSRWSAPAGKPGKHADTSFPRAGKRSLFLLTAGPGRAAGAKARACRARTHEAQPRPGPGAGVRYPAPDAGRPPRAPPPSHLTAPAAECLGSFYESGGRLVGGAVASQVTKGCSPRLRGWSHARAAPPGRRDVLPAPAGLVFMR